MYITQRMMGGILKGEVMDDKMITIKITDFEKIIRMVPHNCANCKNGVGSEECTDMYLVGYCKNWKIDI